MRAEFTDGAQGVQVSLLVEVYDESVSAGSGETVRRYRQATATEIKTAIAGVVTAAHGAFGLVP